MQVIQVFYQSAGKHVTVFFVFVFQCNSDVNVKLSQYVPVVKAFSYRSPAVTVIASRGRLC